MSDAKPGDHSPNALPSLVLASTSIYRCQLLERLGVPFRSRSPECDESALTRERAGRDARNLAEELAFAKASSVASIEPGATVIGCDQLVSFQGRIFGKPMSGERAIEQLEMMSGQTHELITAMVVIQASRVIHHTDTTTLRMRALTRAAIERYVLADRPLDCAGSYKLESRAITLFDQIETRDHTAITGLPLIALVTILRDLGFQIP
jgi:7-methyl-GTP pyrophosphatase